MEWIINFFKNNYQWLFSGILSGFIFFLIGNKVGYNRCVKQKQKIWKNGKGIQVGGNYTIVEKKDE